MDSLEGLDERESTILMCIFKFQLEDPKGITWGDLLELDEIEREMSRQTFSRRLRGLLERGLVEKEIVKGRKGKPTLYRLKSKLFSDLVEFREKFYPWYLEREIKRFEKDIESFGTQQYVEAIMELALSRLNVLVIALMAFETEGARWLFYDATYQNIEQLLRYILNRASRSKKDKEQTLTKLFELLESFASRSIGKRFKLNEVCNSREKIIKAIVEKE